MNNIVCNYEKLLEDSSDSDDSILQNISLFCNALLQYMQCDNWHVAIIICAEAYMRTLNLAYRNKDMGTDILSFSFDNTESDQFILYEDDAGALAQSLQYKGDIALCFTYIAENAQRFNVSFENELRRVLVHGLLHLYGMEHATSAPDEPMLQYQEKIMDYMNEHYKELLC